MGNNTTTTILKPKVEASGIMEVIGLGVSKSVTERGFAPVIGNATVKSGAIKLVTGGLVYGLSGKMNLGKLGHIVSSGIIVDGIEDVISSFINGRTNNAESGVTW